MLVKNPMGFDKFKRVGRMRVPLVHDCETSVPVPCSILANNHPCKGCVWYARDTNVLFCPFSNCVRNKKGFGNAKEAVNAD